MKNKIKITSNIIFNHFLEYISPQKRIILKNKKAITQSTVKLILIIVIIFISFALIFGLGNNFLNIFKP